ncbi:MAG: hypothetical protein IKY67_06365 [Paludibacteraceae bacterium]|nr:hypothetical protein [Paludibacteraceae bacterium]
MKKYIDNFVDDFNYQGVILYIKKVDKNRLLEKLKSDYLNHLYYFDPIYNSNGLMLIENCDCIDVNDNEILEYLLNGYNIVQLREDANGYFFEITSW